MGEVWTNAIALNFSKELDSTGCSIQVLERLDFWSDAMYNQFKFLVFVNIKTKKVFRRSAFIQTNIFFLKLKRSLTKKMYHILTTEY